MADEIDNEEQFEEEFYAQFATQEEANEYDRQASNDFANEMNHPMVAVDSQIRDLIKLAQTREDFKIIDAYTSMIYRETERFAPLGQGSMNDWGIGILHHVPPRRAREVLDRMARVVSELNGSNHRRTE